MTQENLIDLACRWLDNHQSQYIQSYNSAQTIYVSGACQTDLRAFLNWCIKNHPEDDLVFYYDLIKEYNEKMV